MFCRFARWKGISYGAVNRRMDCTPRSEIKKLGTHCFVGGIVNRGVWARGDAPSPHAVLWKLGRRLHRLVAVIMQ